MKHFSAKYKALKIEKKLKIIFKRKANDIFKYLEIKASVG